MFNLMKNNMKFKKIGDWNYLSKFIDFWDYFLFLK